VSSYHQSTGFYHSARSLARLQPNIGFTGVLAVFTRSVVTPPKVNRSWWNLEHSEYIVTSLADFGREVATVREVQAKCFCRINNARFHQFPDIWTQHVDRWGVKLSKENSENFIVRGPFFQKERKILLKLLTSSLATSGRHNSAMITDRRKFITKSYLYGMFCFHFTVRINWNIWVIPLGCTLRTTMLLPNFSDTSDASDVR